jgi:site-specific recombinase XerD
MEVQDAVTDYLLDITHLEKRTQGVYASRLTVFAAWCKDVGYSLEQVNNRMVQAFLAHVRATRRPHKKGQASLSTHTIAGYVRFIRTFLYWCSRDEEHSQYVKLQTIKGIKTPRTEQVVKKTFSDEEIGALFAACKHPSKPHAYYLRDTAILSVLLDTGIRAAELRTLTIARVTLAREVREESYLTVMGKGRREREVPLGNKARRALARYLREVRRGAAQSDPVFLSRHGGQLSHEALKDILGRLKALSTLPAQCAVNPHKFRHSYATCFMAMGGDLYDLSRFLGHRSIIVTEEYIKSLGAAQVRKRKERTSVLDHLKDL